MLRASRHHRILAGGLPTATGLRVLIPCRWIWIGIYMVLLMFIIDLIILADWNRKTTIPTISTKFDIHHENIRERQFEKPKLTSPSDTRVLIVKSTFRSGSSLTGDILQQDSTVFYVYEPLVSLHNALVANRSSLLLLLVYGGVQFLLLEKRARFRCNREEITDLQKKWQTFSRNVRAISNLQFYNTSVRIIKSLITCDFEHVDVDTLSHGFLHIGFRTMPYIACVDKIKNSTTLHSSVRQCLPLLKTTCEEAKHRILKIVRLPMDIMERFLLEFPKMLVLHLVRDPRAIENSKANIGAKIFKDLKKDSTELCAKLSWDLFYANYLNPMYNYRIIRLYYEDLALHPINTTRWLFQKVGLQISKEIDEYIYSITSAGNDDSCSICVVRANSSAHIDLWKKSFNKSHVTVIEQECKDYMTSLGYRLVSSEM